MQNYYLTEMYTKFNTFKLGGWLGVGEAISMNDPGHKDKKIFCQTQFCQTFLPAHHLYIVRNFQKVHELLIACTSYKEEMGV